MNRTLGFAVGNIKANPRMPDAHVRSDTAKLFDLGMDVTAGAEINYGYSKSVWDNTAKAFGRKTYNLTTEVPISTNQDVKRSWVTRLHDGVARVTPARYNSQVRLDDEGGPSVLVIAKHPVSGAFRNAPTTYQRLRQRLFGTDLSRTKARVSRANANGVSVVILGDLNVVTAPMYSPAQQTVIHYGLMHILVCPAPDHTVKHLSHGHVRASSLHTDHPFLWGVIRLEEN